jgi:hypothetical protein
MALPAISICATNFFQTKAASDYALYFINNLPEKQNKPIKDQNENGKKNDTTQSDQPPPAPKDCDPKDKLSNLNHIKKAFNLPKKSFCLERYNVIIGDLKENISTPQTSDELKQSFGLNRSQIIIECLTGDLAEQCRPEQIVWFFDTNYGNCFRINRYSFLTKIVII